jgi:hypothetical protein
VSLDVCQLIAAGFQDSVDMGCSKTAACVMVGIDIHRLEPWQETPQVRRRGGIQRASQAPTKQDEDLVVETFQVSAPALCQQPNPAFFALA